MGFKFLSKKSAQQLFSFCGIKTESKRFSSIRAKFAIFNWLFENQEW
jgi:hypothetical protein